MEKLVMICTCDDNCDSPCPAHCRENALQDENIELKATIKRQQAENTQIARQLAQSEARARELFEALELVEMTRYTDDYHWAEIMDKVGQQVNKHADHFRKGDQ
jgi:hypothetical protein